jgi:hypothetical protein
MYRRCTAAAFLPVVQAPQPARPDQSIAMQLQTLTARAQAPPCALHSRCSARQSLQPAGPGTAPCRRAGPRGCIRAAATAADGSLRTPHSGYHWDGTPRRCEWAVRLRQLPSGPVSAPAPAASTDIHAGSVEERNTVHFAQTGTRRSRSFQPAPHRAACAPSHSGAVRCLPARLPPPPPPPHPQSSRAGTSR